MFPQDIEKGLAPYPLPILQRAVEIPEKHAHGWYLSFPFSCILPHPFSDKPER